MNLKPANILNASLHRGARVESAGQLSAIMGRAAPERVDIYRSKSGAAQLGVAWPDGSTFITDVDSWTSLTVWVAAEIDSGRVRPSEVRQHVAGGAK